MSDVRRHDPANRLATALDRAAPLSLEEALRRAERNLASIADDCRTHVLQSLDRLEQAVAAWPAAADSAYLEQLMQLSGRIVGSASAAHLPALGSAAASLADVLAGLETRRLWERAPVEVHVRSMRLLGDGALPQADAGKLLAALEAVRRRYQTPL